MSDLIDRQDAIEAICSKCQEKCIPCEVYPCYEVMVLQQVQSAQVAHIQDFVQYQVDWLTEHNDLELEPELEDLVIRFLKDTASCYQKEYLTSAQPDVPDINDRDIGTWLLDDYIMKHPDVQIIAMSDLISRVEPKEDEE